MPSRQTDSKLNSRHCTVYATPPPKDRQRRQFSRRSTSHSKTAPPTVSEQAERAPAALHQPPQDSTAHRLQAPRCCSDPLFLFFSFFFFLLCHIPSSHSCSVAIFGYLHTSCRPMLYRLLGYLLLPVSKALGYWSWGIQNFIGTAIQSFCHSTSGRGGHDRKIRPRLSLLCFFFSRYPILLLRFPDFVLVRGGNGHFCTHDSSTV
ncbi:hypothetical protein MAPG_07056 [Magnaporthiopsis poae ATCC 64411]|uniref:Uncharacterized protein n=1 Tax=Magnaporthiopsis poae (strain ATCC 64411 / 73-15) TaxID=644358 RepID=A0A0C4E3P1_MAGP6|nr:hypothetical protein MAPG_07056 [Magnaporthiopsis poae ATCC 64411]